MIRVMKKLHSFSDLETGLKQEKIPYEDHKKDILENLNTTKNNATYLTRKVLVICASLLLFISLTSAAIATKGFGLIPENQAFIEAHNGEIITSLYDTSGNCVYEIGIIQNENIEEHGNDMLKRHNLDNDFENISKSLEAELPNDKVALLIPVKNLDSFINLNILNSTETYKSIEDMQKEGINVPTPAYLPEGFTFTEIMVNYQYEDPKELTDIQTINQFFNETKAEGKDYYYKEYDRYTSFGHIYLTYTNKVGKELFLRFRKGKGCSLSDPVTIHQSSDTTQFIEKEIPIQKSVYNGREYAVEDNNTYHSYFYTSDQLWSILILSSSYIEAEEIMKMVESMSY